MISRKVARELHTKPNVRNNLGNRGCTRESGFDPMELWVMGPPCGFFCRSSDILHGHDSKACQRVPCQLCRQHVGTKGEGRRELFSCSLKRGGPIGKVLVHRWLPECYQQKQQGLTDTVVHQGVYISRRILLLRSYGSQGRLNNSMERKM